MKRILYITSKIWDWCESQSCMEWHIPAQLISDTFIHNFSQNHATTCALASIRIGTFGIVATLGMIKDSFQLQRLSRSFPRATNLSVRQIKGEPKRITRKLVQQHRRFRRFTLNGLISIVSHPTSPVQTLIEDMREKLNL